MADPGDVLLDADLAKGIVKMTVRAPLSIASQTCEVPFTEFAETALTIILEGVKVSRQVQAKMAHDIQATRQ